MRLTKVHKDKRGQPLGVGRGWLMYEGVRVELGDAALARQMAWQLDWAAGIARALRFLLDRWPDLRPEIYELLEQEGIEKPRAAVSWADDDEVDD